MNEITVPIVITSDNFDEMLPKICEYIHNCDFVAFDYEFSGLSADNKFKELSTDTIELRYSKACKAIDKYAPLSCGLCLFSYNKEKKSYDPIPINIYLSPLIHKDLPSFDISLNSSTLSFLLSHQFDFSLSYNKGVPCLNRNNEQMLQCKYMSMSLNQKELSTILQSDTRKQINSMMKLINEWLLTRNDKIKQRSSQYISNYINEYKKKNPTVDVSSITVPEDSNTYNDLEIEYIQLPPCDSGIRKYIYGELDIMFDTTLPIEVYEEVGITKEKYYALEQQISKNNKQKRTMSKTSLKKKFDSYNMNYSQLKNMSLYYSSEPTNNQIKSIIISMKPQESSIYKSLYSIKQYYGIRLIYEEIIQSQKYLVGFQCFTDLLYMIRRGLQSHETVLDFQQFVEKNIKGIVDCKLLLYYSPLSSLLGDAHNLSQVYEFVKNSDLFNGSTINDSLYSSDITSENNCHNSSYDAYMTGYVFIKIAEHFTLSPKDIQSLFSSSPHYILPNLSPLLQLNKTNENSPVQSESISNDMQYLLDNYISSLIDSYSKQNSLFLQTDLDTKNEYSIPYELYFFILNLYTQTIKRLNNSSSKVSDSTSPCVSSTSEKTNTSETPISIQDIQTTETQTSLETMIETTKTLLQSCVPNLPLGNISNTIHSFISNIDSDNKYKCLPFCKDTFISLINRVDLYKLSTPLCFYPSIFQFINTYQYLYSQLYRCLLLSYTKPIPKSDMYLVFNKFLKNESEKLVFISIDSNLFLCLCPNAELCQTIYNARYNPSPETTSSCVENSINIDKQLTTDEMNNNTQSKVSEQKIKTEELTDINDIPENQESKTKKNKKISNKNTYKNQSITNEKSKRIHYCIDDFSVQLFDAYEEICGYKYNHNSNLPCGHDLSIYSFNEQCLKKCLNTNNEEKSISQKRLFENEDDNEDTKKPLFE